MKISALKNHMDDYDNEVRRGGHRLQCIFLSLYGYAWNCEGINFCVNFCTLNIPGISYGLSLAWKDMLQIVKRSVFV